MIEVDKILDAVVNILSSDSIVRKYVRTIDVCMGEQVKAKDTICVTAGSINSAGSIINHNRYSVVVDVNIFIRGLNMSAVMEVFNPLIGRIEHLLHNNQKLGGLTMGIIGSAVNPAFRPEENSEMYLTTLSVTYDVID